MQLFRTISLLIIMFIIVNVSAHDGNIHTKNGMSKAMLSGIKGVCNNDPVSYIIRQHPELLKHKRDKTLRKGVRTSKYSLQGCIQCHASKVEGIQDKYHAINDDGQFCSNCHKKVAVSLDCFECHRTKPIAKKDNANIKIGGDK